MVLPRSARLLLVFILSVMCECAPPLQMGGVVVAPGATERILAMMQLGLMFGGDETGPSRVLRLSRNELFPTGRASNAKIGDWLLENRKLFAVVAQIDGSARGGRLIDLSHKPGNIDGLDGYDLRVWGQRVVYETLRTGFDDA